VSLVPGLRATVSLTVSDADTAIALGSGDVPVLGTPRVVALCEQATCAALAGHLDPGRTTVGTRVELDHLAATAVGRTVHAEAVLVEVDGPRLRFYVRAHDGDTDLAVGSVRRVAVDVERFLGKLR